MARGGLGDRIQVMNITSKSVLFGQVQQNGSILVIN
jgi:flagella basal body P-ring formation protein FlgA